MNRIEELELLTRDKTTNFLLQMIKEGRDEGRDEQLFAVAKKMTRNSRSLRRWSWLFLTCPNAKTTSYQIILRTIIALDFKDSLTPSDADHRRLISSQKNTKVGG